MKIKLFKQIKKLSNNIKYNALGINLYTKNLKVNQFVTKYKKFKMNKVVKIRQKLQYKTQVWKNQ